MYVLLAVRSLVGTVFILSSLTKLQSPRSFVLSVHKYRILPTHVGSAYGWFLVGVELPLGAALFAGWKTFWFGLAAGVILTTFAAAVAVVLLRKQKTDCGCFGLLYKERVGPLTLGRDLVLIAMSGWVSGSASHLPSFQTIVTQSATPARVEAWVLLGTAALVVVLAVRKMLASQRDKRTMERARRQLQERSKLAV